MKKIKMWKRISACILAVTLILGVVPVSYMNVRADESQNYAGRLWVAGAIPSHSCTATCLHLRGTDSFASTVSSTDIILKAVDDESGIFLNDVKGALWLVKYDGPSNAYMVGGLGDVEVTAGTTVTIKGRFKASNEELYGTDSVTFEQTSFVFDGTTWTESADADESSPLILTSGDINGINVQANTAFQKDSSWKLRAYAVRDGISGVYVDGVWKNVPLILLQYEDGSTNHNFGLIDVGVTATAGTTVVIKGKFVQGNHVVIFPQSTFTFDGTSWAQQTEEFSVTGLRQVLIGADQQWQIWMGNDGTFAGQESEGFTWPALLNGEKVEGGIQVFKDGGMFFANIWPSRIPSDGTAEVTLVLQKGTVGGSKGSVVTLSKDVTLCFNKYGLSMDTPIQVDTTGVEFEVIQAYSSQSGVYLEPSKSDVFSETVDVTPSVLTGGLKNGRWYFPQEGSVTIGEQVFAPQTGVTFVKHNTWGITGGYYVGDYDVNLVQTGTKMTIKGIFEADGKLVEYVPTVLQWDGAKWSKLTTLSELAEGTTVIEPEYTVEDSSDECQYVTFNRLSLIQTYTSADGAEKAWDIYLKPSESFAANSDEAYKGLQVTVKNKTSKTTFDATFYNAGHDEGTAFFRISEGRIPFDITEATEVIVHAGNATSVTTGKQMKLMQDCILQIDTEENWTKPLYDGTKWEIHMTTDGQFSGVEDEIFLWPAMIGDKETTLEVTKEGENFVLHLTSLQLPTDGTAGNITIKAATITGSAGSVITLALDKTLYVDQYGLQADAPIEPDTKGVSMTSMRTSHNHSKAGIYLHAMKKDAIPVDDSWKIRPLAANDFVDGTYYFNHNSGIFIDGVSSSVNIGSPQVEYIKVQVFYNEGIPETTKYNEYYIGLSNVTDKIVDGTVVIIKGLFVYDGKLVEYLPTYFEWDEETTSWSVSLETTYVSGDANGDGVADARDVVRIKRYLGQKEEIQYATPEIPISFIDADLIMEEDTYVINDVDLQELKWQLLGAAEIELAAYCGPRREGYRYYSDNDNDDGSDGNYDGNMNVAIEYGTHPEDPEGGWKGWITEKDFQDYVNCGFTYLLPEQDAFYDYTFANGPKPVDSYYDSDLYEYMQLAEKMNIPVLVHANSLTAMSDDTDGVLTDGNKAFLEKMYRDLSMYDMFKGYSLADEPSYESAKSFFETKNYLDNLDPSKTFFTAFLPMTASNSLLVEGEAESKEAAYNAYMDSFYQATGTFTYDLYPLITHAKNGNSLEPQWFANLKLVAEHAKENQYDAGIVVQSTSYGNAKNYKLQDHPEHHRTIETKADVGFQVYTALAYGMKSINYYTYWTHWTESARGIDTSAMVNYPTEAGGEPIKTNAYYAVKAINQEIKKFDHVFLNFDWQGTMALTGAEATMSDVLQGALDSGNNYQPENMTATATEETIIGCMKDAKGRDGYMIVNATEPSAGLSSVVTVAFDGATKALAYIEGTETEVILTEGTYEFEVGAGEGIFVIPVSK